MCAGIEMLARLRLSSADVGRRRSRLDPRHGPICIWQVTIPRVLVDTTHPRTRCLFFSSLSRKFFPPRLVSFYFSFPSPFVVSLFSFFFPIDDPPADDRGPQETPGGDEWGEKTRRCGHCRQWMILKRGLLPFPRNALPPPCAKQEQTKRKGKIQRKTMSRTTNGTMMRLLQGKSRL